jgi:hypothetical protein
MASLGQVFNVTEMPEGRSFELVPNGWYQALASGCELRDTKAGNGSYMSIKWTLEGPSHQGRVLFDNINVRNPSEKAEEIGREQMGQLMRAGGLPRLQDTDQVVGIRCEIKVKISEDKTGKYEAQNEVVAYRAIEGATLPPPTVKAPAAPKGGAPW